uniref:Uncharacterized protein n=1 Tax=Arundo donax TaxID=35708 RepID=A0A0A8ZRF1_ARUDO
MAAAMNSALHQKPAEELDFRWCAVVPNEVCGNYVPFLRLEKHPGCLLDQVRHRCQIQPAEARSGRRPTRAAGRRRRRTRGAPASSWSGRPTRRAARVRRSRRTSCPPWRRSPRTPGTGTAPSPAPPRRTPSAPRRCQAAHRRTEPHCLPPPPSPRRDRPRAPRRTRGRTSRLRPVGAARTPPPP